MMDFLWFECYTFGHVATRDEADGRWILLEAILAAGS